MPRQQNETILYRKYLREYNKLAKKADRRMRELERFSRYDEFKNIKKYAYKKAEEMIKAWTPPDKMYKDRAPRWQRNVPFDTRSLKAKIRDIKEFLGMKSSTITGVKKIYQNRADALNDKYKTDFTWEELAHFFEDGGLADKTFGQYGSATVLLAYGKIQNDKSTALRQIKKFDKDHQVTDDDAATQRAITGILKDHGPTVQTLLESR